MQLSGIGKWYRRITINIQGPNGLTAFRLVLLDDGHPGYIINQYIYYLVCMKETSQQKLDQSVRALEHLYAYTLARYSQGTLTAGAQQSLVGGFIDAKKHGTDEYCTTDMPHLQYLKGLGLNWKKIPNNSTIKRYVTAINDFDKWQATFHDAPRLNPSENRFLNAW